MVVTTGDGSVGGFPLHRRRVLSSSLAEDISEADENVEVQKTRLGLNQACKDRCGTVYNSNSSRCLQGL